MTHEAYLDEPADVIIWTNRFAHVEQEVEAELSKRAERKSSGR